MNTARTEVFPPGGFITDELEARGWSHAELAMRMPGNSAENLLVVGMLIHVGPKEKGLLLGEDTAQKLGAAFGTSAQLWTNLDKSWHST